MTQCPCENVSLIFCFFKCCADMSRRNTSQRPPEPPQGRSDRLGARRPAPTSSARREKQELHPPMAGRGRGGGMRLARVDDAGGPRHRRVHPRWWIRHSISRIIRCMSRRMIRRIILRSLSLNSISLMRISINSMRIIMSSLILRSFSSLMVGSCLGGAEGGVQVGSDGYAGRPSDLTLLPRFGGHVACRIWVDADVIIF